ncbi:hypothetical protein [Dolichospermum sp. FACHB-1091]|uniref:hypothetical protein n=1 Tax=Dolichospermum sp. FACHB-1091 TaxID=2692798 RepID=UPI0032209E5D
MVAKDLQPEDLTILDNYRIRLGVWVGNYQGVTIPWLHWYDQNGNWILTSVEKERQKPELEKQKAEQERQKIERLIAQLKSLGVETDLE